jgi:hypothetical protein
MGLQSNMPVQHDSCPPCLYWQLLVFIFGKDSWLQATVWSHTFCPYTDTAGYKQLYEVIPSVHLLTAGYKQLYEVIPSVYLLTGLCSLHPHDHHLVQSSTSTGKWGLRKQILSHFSTDYGSFVPKLTAKNKLDRTRYIIIWYFASWCRGMEQLSR